MKRTYILLLVFVLCLLLLTTIQNKLIAFDFIIIESDAKNILQNTFLLHEYAKLNNHVSDLSIYSVSSGKLNYNHNVMDVTLFGVDPGYLRFENVKVISGRFISKSDIERNTYVAVIEKNHAVQMFASKDCVGKKISIDNTEYTIVGVYEQSNNLLDFLSSTYKNIVYSPIKSKTEDDTKNKEAKILVRTKKGTSVILENMIKTDMAAILSSDIVLNNLDVSSRDTSQKIILSKFFLFVLFSLCFLKAIFNYLKIYFGKIKSQLRHIYLREFIIRHLFEIIMHIVVFCLIVVSFCFLYNCFKFELYINPALLPKRLTDINEIKKNLLDYCLKINTTPGIISSFTSYVSRAGNYTNVLVILLFACYFGLIKDQNILINKAVLALSGFTAKDPEYN